MKNLATAFVDRILVQGPWGGQLHAHYDDDQVTKLLEANGLIARRQLSVNAPSIATGAEGTIDVTLAGVKVGDGVIATLGADVTVGLYLRSAHVSAPGVITFTFANTSGGTIDEAARSVAVLVLPGDLN